MLVASIMSYILPRILSRASLTYLMRGGATTARGAEWRPHAEANTSQPSPQPLKKLCHLGEKQGSLTRHPLCICPKAQQHVKKRGQ